MSVIRQPGILGQTAQRRLVGITTALSAAAVEALAVGTWFALVAVESRTLFTALAGLGVLLFGSLVRTGVFGSVTSEHTSRLSPSPMRLATAVALAGCWVLWLLTAETVGGVTGVAIAGIALAGLLSIQFALERRTYYRQSQSSRTLGTVRRTVLPGVLVAAGATALLSATWFVDWTLVLALVPLGDVTLTLEIGGVALGFASYGLFSFLAQQQRFQRLLTA